VTELRSFGARFWAFLAGQAVSSIGSWATLVAIWGYAAYAFDASPGDVALIGVAWLLPPVVLTPFAGTAIDRLGPRTVIVAFKALGAAASIALVFADSFGLLVLFSVGHGVAYAFMQPALDACPPHIVSDDQLAAANSLLRVATDLAIVLGPVAAAGSIALWDFRGAFVFDAATYLIGIASVFVVTMRPVDHEAEGDERSGTWRETIDGLRFVATSAPLRATIMLTGGVYFLYGSALLLEPVYVRDVLDEPVTTFAYLQSAFGVWLVGVGIFVARLGDRVATRAVLALAVIGSGLGAAWYLGTDSVLMAFAGVMAWGAVTAFIAGPSRTLLQRHAPVGAQGRVLGVDRTMEGIGHLAALPVAGFLASSLGVRPAALVIGLVVVSLGGGGLVLARRASEAESGLGLRADLELDVVAAD
jgi:MFS family permease